MNDFKADEVRWSLTPLGVLGCFHSSHQLFLTSVVLDTGPPFEEADIAPLEQTNPKFLKGSEYTVFIGHSAYSTIAMKKQICNKLGISKTFCDFL